uniref:Uncharacterized protein n=1 Tax=Lynx canadensis TaxID=61383 RepID=A0A667GRC1_LYNCA
MAPARPLSGGPVLGYVAAAVWEGSAPRIQQAREDRAPGVLLGENAAKFICGKKTYCTSNCLKGILILCN